MTRLAQKILTMPGQYTTLQKVAKTYNGNNRPDKEIIDGMMQQLSASHLGLYVMKLGYVKYKLPYNEDLLKYKVDPQLYNERYLTPVFPNESMNAATMQKLDSVAKSLPSRPPRKVDQ